MCHDQQPSIDAGRLALAAMISQIREAVLLKGEQ